MEQNWNVRIMYNIVSMIFFLRASPRYYEFLIDPCFERMVRRARKCSIARILSMLVLRTSRPD